MTLDSEFRVLLALPAHAPRRTVLDVPRCGSFDSGREDWLGRLRALLWGLVFEALIMIGVARCWMLIDHTFRC